jgi:hypothetical protein
VIPPGSVPSARFALPPTFTSEGCTCIEKLLPAKTVVGEGAAQRANTGGMVAGYEYGLEVIGPTSGFVTVKANPPGALVNPAGKLFTNVVGLGPENIVGKAIPFA